MNKDSKILILGASGLVGSTILEELENSNHTNILTPTHKTLDLLNQSDVYNYFLENKPEYVFFAAAKVGGIHANNTYRADFIFENLGMQQNVIGAAHSNNTKRLLFLGSSCIYPKNCPQPIKEEYLLTSELEQTNEPYAIAKIAGLKMCEAFKKQYNHDFISVMPTNLYGLNDNFDLENSHVIPGLIARMSKAIKDGETSFQAWGTGRPRREFLFVNDMAKACIHIMTYQKPLPELLNIGTGEDISIKELVFLIAKHLDFKGEISFDSKKPDGTMQKLLDVSRMHSLGWKHSTSLESGIKKVCNHYRKKFL